MQQGLIQKIIAHQELDNEFLEILKKIYIEIATPEFVPYHKQLANILVSFTCQNRNSANKIKKKNLITINNLTHSVSDFCLDLIFQICTLNSL